MQQSNYAQVEHLIRQMSTERVSEAEDKMRVISKNDPQTFYNLVKILLNPNVQQWIKLIASSYINNGYCEQLFSLDIGELNKGVISILEDVRIVSVHKRILERSLVQMIDNLQQPNLTQFRELIHLFMKNQQLRDTAYLLIGCFCVPELQVNHPMYLFRLYLNPTLDLITSLNQSQQSLKMAIQYNEIFKTWIVVWDAIALYTVQQIHDMQQDGKKTKTVSSYNKKQYNQEAANLLADVVDNQRLCRVLIQVYQWLGNDGIYFCGHKQLIQLNMIKYNASELHWRLLKYITEHSLPETTLIQKLTQKIIPLLLSNILLFKNQRDIIQNYGCKDLAANFIKIVMLYVQIKPAYFQNAWKQILVGITFPLLKIDEAEMIQFEEDKQDFIALFQDCSQTQKFGIVKSEAAKLLEVIGQNGAAITQKQIVCPFILQYAIDSMAKSIGAKVAQQQYYTQQGIQLTTFECAMQIFSIFSFRLKDYQQILQPLSKIITKQVVMNLPPLDRSRWYSYLGYNYADTYSNLNNGSFMIQLALQDQGHPTVMHSAIDFLSNIADQFYDDFFLLGLSAKIQNCQNAILFSVISKLVDYQYHRLNSDLLVDLVHKIIAKISQQLKIINNNNQQVKRTQKVMKLIQIIQMVVQQIYTDRKKQDIKQQDIQPKNNNQLKSATWAITSFLKPAYKLDIDQQILRVIYQFAKNQPTFTENQAFNTLIPDLLYCFKADEYSQMIYYRILNNYIMKNNYNQAILEIIKSLHGGVMGLFISKTIKINKKTYRIIFGNLLVLLQNAIALHGDKLSKQQIQGISCIPVHFIPQNVINKPDIQPEIYDKILLGRAINLLLLCHLHDPVEGVWNIVLQFYKFEIFYSYDLRVLIACIKKSINQQDNLQNIALLISILANCIDTYIKRKQIEGKAAIIRQKKGKGNANTRIQLSKDQDYNKLIKSIITPFTTQVSKNYVKQMEKLLVELRGKNAEAYQALIHKYLSKQDKQILNKLIRAELMANGQRRIIYNISSAKVSGLNNFIQQDQRYIHDSDKFENVEKKQNNMNMNMNSDEQSDGIGEFKRRRVEKKKKGGKKRNKQQSEMNEDD